MISPVLIDSLGARAYLIFMAIAYAFVPVVYLFFPETSGLSLEGIDYLFIEGGPASTAFIKAEAKRNIRREAAALNSLAAKEGFEHQEEALPNKL